MSSVYPLRTVITNDAELAQRYNSDSTSAFMVSGCLSTAEASELISEGASMDAVVLVNGVGEDLVHEIGEQVDWDKELLPEIVRVSVDAAADEVVEEIHQALREASSCAVWAG